MDNKYEKERKKYDSAALFQRILERIEHIENKKKAKKSALSRPMTKWTWVAATLFFLIGLFLVYQKHIWTPFDPASNVHTPNSEVITLQLDNGAIETISVNDERNITTTNGNLVGSQQGNTIRYSGKETGNELVYNTLKVPYGRRFDLILSDGTKVKLNSGSSIKYPVSFLKGRDRKVFLNGEAYFDVAKDNAHPFIVNADQMNIQVLGTQFNLSYYPEDKDISTVLVEGAVVLYKEGANITTNSSIQLVPGQKAAWNKTTNEMSIKEVDTDIYTAWKDGYLLFKASPFYSIRTKLERHFNITIVDKSRRLDNQIYTATFRSETIEEILEVFREDTPFKFIRQGSEIIILDTNIN